MIFQTLKSEDIVTARSFLNQLIDILQQDISNALNRKKYQVFVTGGIGPGVTSSLFQTIYDQDHTYVSSNPIFDMTVGLFGDKDLNLTVASTSPTVDANGKLLFPSQSMMMREKIDIYRQFAQQLLGDANKAFYLPWDSTNSANRVDNALFLSFKRLFSRDGIQRDTFAMRFSSKAFETNPTDETVENIHTPPGIGNLKTYVDMGSSSKQGVMFGGNVGSIYENGTENVVGTLFYDRGVAVLDLAKICFASQPMSGSINAMNAVNYVSPWDNDGDYDGPGNTSMGNNLLGPSNSWAAEPFIPNFITSASIDNILDHLSLRFGQNPETALTFQNITNVNSTLFFCRARPEDYNYSSNPTFVDSTTQQITVIEPGQENTQQSFTFITSVGLYDKDGTLLAVAKLSRPIEKNAQRDLTVRVRLDFAKKKSFSVTK